VGSFPLHCFSAPSNIKSDTHLPPRTRLSAALEILVLYARAVSFFMAVAALRRAQPLLKAIKQAFIGHYGQDATLILI
jgi:hypothetical protein